MKHFSSLLVPQKKSPSKWKTCKQTASLQAEIYSFVNSPMTQRSDFPLKTKIHCSSGWFVLQKKNWMLPFSHRRKENRSKFLSGFRLHFCLIKTRQNNISGRVRGRVWCKVGDFRLEFCFNRNVLNYLKQQTKVLKVAFLLARAAIRKNQTESEGKYWVENTLNLKV